jgi:hypothetical protein
VAPAADHQQVSVNGGVEQNAGRIAFLDPGHHLGVPVHVLRDFIDRRLVPGNDRSIAAPVS